MENVDVILSGASYWLYVGAVVALAFLTFGIDRIDENARGTYLFRILLIPGVLLIWPLVLWRWAALEIGGDRGMGPYRPQRRAHGWMWLVFSILIPAIFLVAIFVRQQWPADAPAVRLSFLSESARQ